MKKNNNVFDELKKTNIAYAIIINKDDSFIIISEKDKDKVKSLNFKRSKDKSDLFDRFLTKNEIKIFHSIKENYKFIDIIDSEVYELPNNSFKTYYESLNL